MKTVKNKSGNLIFKEILWAVLYNGAINAYKCRCPMGPSSYFSAPRSIPLINWFFFLTTGFYNCKFGVNLAVFILAACRAWCFNDERRMASKRLAHQLMPIDEQYGTIFLLGHCASEYRAFCNLIILDLPFQSFEEERQRLGQWHL